MDTHGFAILFAWVFPSGHHLGQGRADGTATGPLATVSSHTVVLVDACGTSVISVHAGFLAIALVDAYDFIIVIMRAHSSHRKQGHGGGIATVYPGVPSHHPSSLPIPTTDKTSASFLHKFKQVPTCYIYQKQHLRRCSKTKGGQFQVLHLLLRNSSTREGLLQESFQESAAIFHLK